MYWISQIRLGAVLLQTSKVRVKEKPARLIKGGAATGGGIRNTREGKKKKYLRGRGKEIRVCLIRGGATGRRCRLSCTQTSQRFGNRGIGRRLLGTQTIVRGVLGSCARMIRCSWLRWAADWRIWWHTTLLRKLQKSGSTHSSPQSLPIWTDLEVVNMAQII